jgi:hypothetical protein
MEINFFNEYLASIKTKNRIVAKKYLNKFIKSFKNYAEKEQWTKIYLAEQEQKEYKHIRHELFVEIISPVLLKGYNDRDIQSMIWIIKFNHIFRQHTDLWKKIDQRNSESIIIECYKIDPDNEEIIKLYTEKVLNSVNNYIYWINDYKKNIDSRSRALLEDLQFLKQLDRGKKYSELINRSEERINENLLTVEKLNTIEEIK